MDRPYDVGVLTAKYSERRIRIADMIGRRGRFFFLACAGLFGLYTEVLRNPKPDFAIAFSANNLFEGVVGSWIFLGVFYLNGFIGTVFYGPQSRVMDGYLARANYLLITTLWTAFKFVMVPISLKLATLYPRNEFAVVFGLIWLSYIATDGCAEIFGSLFGKQTIKVWGIGDVNRKSVVGVVAGFLGALIVNLALSGSQRPVDRRRGSAWRAPSLCRTASSSSTRRAAPTTSRWRPPTRCSASPSAPGSASGSGQARRRQTLMASATSHRIGSNFASLAAACMCGAASGSAFIASNASMLSHCA